jgi:hypothetical protein
MLRSSNSDPTGALLLGLGAGVVMFYRGFRKFREYKVVADTPRIPIRSVPMGLVHVRGTAQSDQLVTSPLTHTPCCFYQVVVERWKTENNSGNWEHHCTDRDGIKFYLQDETGKILIDSYSAEYDVPAGAVRIVDSGKSTASLTASGATDVELLQYVEKAGAHALFQKGQHWLEAKGTLATPQKEQARQHVLQLMQSGLSFMRDGKLPVDLILKGLESQPPLADPEHERQRQAVIQRIRESGTLPIHDLPTANPASGRYRLHEYLILPGQQYFVTGTCAENPQPKDAHDRNMIEKGRNESTFLISAQPEQQAQTSMRGGAFKMVFSGTVLTLGCLGLLLLHWKMF